VHKTHEGCPSIYLGVPTRHIHSHVGILDLADLEHLVNLVIALVKKMDAKTVASFTNI
jgi:endoglucanase